MKHKSTDTIYVNYTCAYIVKCCTDTLIFNKDRILIILLNTRWCVITYGIQGGLNNWTVCCLKLYMMHGGWNGLEFLRCGFELCLGTIAQWQATYTVCLCQQAVPLGTAKGRWRSEAAKVTERLATHWPRITSSLAYNHLQAQGQQERDEPKQVHFTYTYTWWHTLCVKTDPYYIFSGNSNQFGRISIMHRIAMMLT